MRLHTLRERFNAGEKLKFLPFWKPGPGIGKHIFSQWQEELPFTEGGITFVTAEHYMMIGKARLFGDAPIIRKMIATSDPREVKKLGKQVANFDEGTWRDHRYGIVRQGNLLKFRQNEPALKFLLSTGSKVLVEASPYDDIWGIKLGEGDPRCFDPNQWQGTNLLGFALMDVREELGGS